MSTVTLIWEQIDDQFSTSYRAKVVNGWLFKIVENVHVSLHEDMTPQEGYEWRTSICFIPDINHNWGN